MKANPAAGGSNRRTRALLVGGLRTTLPLIDDFLPRHTLASLEPWSAAQHGFAA